MIVITKYISLNPADIKLTFIASPGPGGQNVNKVATAVQLRFDVLHSPSLPESVRARLLTMLGKKITKDGELIIKASTHRTQERNKQDALHRLCLLIKRAAIVPKKRKKTKPTLASKQRRLTTKKLHSARKALRRAPVS
ncbi:peptide chain release factor I [Gammaproteobacteria bacterium SCGC AG-212-F23]|nr:peptide chain release factor I [Gammaproteobacteria bacterium SCGC AG-212-F23]